MKRLLLKLSFSLFSVSCLANEGDTDWRNITGFGCHLMDGTCYINIDGPAVGPPECLKNDVRFDTANPPNGNTWLSIIELAYATNKRIRLNIIGCYANQVSYPTFSYGRIEK